MERTNGDGKGTPNRRRATHPTGYGDGDGGKKKCKMADLELEIFQNPYLCAYTKGATTSAMVSSHNYEVELYVDLETIQAVEGG